MIILVLLVLEFSFKNKKYRFKYIELHDYSIVLLPERGKQIRKPKMTDSDTENDTFSIRNNISDMIRMKRGEERRI